MTIARAPRLALACFLLVLATAPAHAAYQPARPWIVERAGRSVELETRVYSRREYVDVEAVASFFGLQETRDKKRIELVGPSGRVDLQIGRAMVFVKDQPLLLGGEVLQDDRRGWVPLEFVTRAMARLVGVDARQDVAARSIRFDARTGAVTCESFADRMRVTVQGAGSAPLSDVVSEGRRRIVSISGKELASQAGGCLFDETLSDLSARPDHGGTVLTFFVGPRFSSLKVYQVADKDELVLDFFNDASESAPPPEAEPAAESPAPAATDDFDTVVIDPGHGGADLGAVGPGGLKEKDLTLSVALELARILREKSRIDVVLTREHDSTLPLVERTEIANRNAADLFLSIHANASPGREARGAETYFLHLDATDEASRTTAALENDATGLRQRGGGGGDLEMLLWDMAQQQYLEESSALAESVQRELNDLAGTKDRGVKQANFLVLRGATMPAVLVEVGFLSSPAEEKKMKGAEFRSATAEAIARAIVAFRDARRARSGP